ncbi:hypothetical protein [Desulfosudis oleivorans]|uniref:Uncharacterized protein n=1 Tax=Desulfosudis oleivorans (strain DSM 6200 / JCM 39069 / Hxd3) TaxID=96561 RepID=A8ZYJ6_DESOH|nr:hypothetical protein [Desulfosudis oleivorans]ABW68721.1 hypothetical protein Dole_2918 [Desulfosudis oleivorans Hxd3]
MPVEMLHFRGSDAILKEKRLISDIHLTMDYLSDVLDGSSYRRELTHQALAEMGWRENGTLAILEGRRYQHKGFKKRIALEGNFATYEYILEGLLRLQVSFDKGRIDAGVLMLTAQRSEKSSYGSSYDLVKTEVEMLTPTISLPVSVALFDIGRPVATEYIHQGGNHGISVPAGHTPAAENDAQVTPP